MRQTLVVGNWKMHLTPNEAVDFSRSLVADAFDFGRVTVVLCPPFTALYAVFSVIETSEILLGAQNVHWEEKGAYTGEIAPAMLRDCGCKYVIIGHSERRQLFEETDNAIRSKVSAALRHGLTPILCVGETESQREAGATERVVSGQLLAAIAGLTPAEIKEIAVAYEPVWAIGTGKAASPKQATEVHGLLRRLLDDACGEASPVPVLYGGSVKPENAGDFFTLPEIDGALVGGASLGRESFLNIVRRAMV